MIFGTTDENYFGWCLIFVTINYNSMKCYKYYLVEELKVQIIKTHMIYF